MKHLRLSANEILWATAWALLALSLTSLPYILGCYPSSPEMHFGGFVIAVEDGNSYIAKMGHGARGEWLFHLLYTSEDHDGAILFTFHSSYEVGNYIPARSGNRVFWGHGPETIHVEEKENIVRQFFQAQTSDTYRKEIVSRYNIAYLFYGPAERDLGDFQPATRPYLEEAFTNGRYIIYEVNPGR